MTETMTLVSEGERTVIGITLPKDKPKSPTRKVTFEPEDGKQYGPAGWIYADALGDIKIGDLVSYRIEKNADGFNKVVHIAPVDHSQRDQTVAPATAPRSDRDDAQGGDAPIRRDLDSNVPAARDVPNSDTQRFEGWAFVANVGMVDLAYEELSDALEAGELDSITPELLKTVAQHLLTAADQAQRALVGRTDRGAQSHTRARGCVRTALSKYPVRVQLRDFNALGLTPDVVSTLNGWAANIQKTASRLLQLAASL